MKKGAVKVLKWRPFVVSTAYVNALLHIVVGSRIDSIVRILVQIHLPLVCCA